MSKYQLLRHKQSVVNALTPLKRGEYIVPLRGVTSGGAPPGWTNPFPNSEWVLTNRGDGLGNMTP